MTIATTGDIAWHPVSLGAAAALAAHAAGLLGPGEVTSGRLCPSCGSSGHGRPWLDHGSRRVHVSLARSGRHLVTAIGPAPLGVDVEAVAVDIPPELVLAPGEQAATSLELARTWARKEAILKARGTGLDVEMTSVRLAEECWRDLPAPQGYVAALATGRPRTGRE